MTGEEAIGRILEHLAIHSRKEPFTPHLDKAFGMAIEALRERPHGEWIDRSDDGRISSAFWERYKCSKCGWKAEKTNYCPNCGSDMRTKEGEAE